MREQIFVEIKLNKRIAQNKTYCSVFLWLNHSSFHFFQDTSLSREQSWNFLSIALWCIPSTPFPGYQRPKLHTHTHSMTQTGHFLAQHSWKKTHLIKTAPPEFSLASFKSKSKKRRGALSKIQCFTAFNRKGADLK